MADTDTVDVKFLKQKVFHDGTSMIVAKKGDTKPVPERLIAAFVSEGAITAPDGWEESLSEKNDLAIADGAVFVAPPASPDAGDDDDTSGLPALTGKNKADLLAIAAAESVTIADGATNAEIVTAIEAARTEANAPPA